MPILVPSNNGYVAERNYTRVTFQTFKSNSFYKCSLQRQLKVNKIFTSLALCLIYQAFEHKMESHLC